jgi:hypothetical protein
MRRGLWFVEPEKTIFGFILLCIDPDLNFCFARRLGRAAKRGQ